MYWHNVLLFFFVVSKYFFLIFMLHYLNWFLKLNEDEFIQLFKLLPLDLVIRCVVIWISWMRKFLKNLPGELSVFHLFHIIHVKETSSLTNPSLSHTSSLHILLFHLNLNHDWSIKNLSTIIIYHDIFH